MCLLRLCLRINDSGLFWQLCLEQNQLYVMYMLECIVAGIIFMIMVLFFQFATEGLAVVLFMKMTGMASLDDIPEGLPKSKSSRSTWLHRHCRLVVDHVNSATNPDDVQLVEEAMRQPTPGADDTSLFPFCICREG